MTDQTDDVGLLDLPVDEQLRWAYGEIVKSHEKLVKAIEFIEQAIRGGFVQDEALRVLASIEPNSHVLRGNKYSGVKSGAWYITTGLFKNDGEVVIGPFLKPGDARDTRDRIERFTKNYQLWIDQAPDGAGP